MTKDDTDDARTGDIPDKQSAGPRKSRTIRFSDSEWNRVETAANEQGISTAEFVRNAAICVADVKPQEQSGKISPGLIALIESTYRYTYFLSTLKRDELIREQRSAEVDDMVQAARASQSLLLNKTSD